MEKNEILENLDKNLKELDFIENEISMTKLAIYQKQIEELKNIRTNELKEYFLQNAKFYGQKSENFEEEILKYISEYINQITKIANVYNYLYLNVFKIMQKAINNQKIAEANIVTISEKLQKVDLTVNEKNVYRNTMIACAQKKINYSVIVDECNGRIDWCIENSIKDLDEIFKNNISQLQLYNNNIFNKIIKNISNKITGKKKFKKFLKNYENQELKNIKKENNIKILNVKLIIAGFLYQMNEVKKQISNQYLSMSK